MLLSNAQGLYECMSVSDKTRLAAKRAYRNFWQNRKDSGVGIEFGLSVGFADVLEISCLEQEGRNQCVTYDLKWMEENLDYPTILNNFIYVFGQADLYFRSTLPAFSHEMNAFENGFMCHGKKMYQFLLSKATFR